jgi:glutaredoxin 3
MREQLEYDGRQYIEFDVERDAAALDRLIALTGGRTVPALVDSGRVIDVGWRGRGCMV